VKRTSVPEISHRDLMHATAIARPFSRPGWVFELKYDGFRCLTVKAGADVRLLSRNGRDMAGSFPEIVEHVRQLREDVAIDSELVVQDEAGKPVFERLVRRAATRKPDSALIAARRDPAAIFAFDLLALRDEDLRRQPLLRRKAALEHLLHEQARLRYAGHIGERGVELFAKAEELELEGIVGKRGDSLYTAGRSRDWVKLKTAIGREREARRMEHLRR
jgi:bifunctional non-homologous end joining protein LigD